VDLAPGVVGGVGGRVAIDINNVGFVPSEVARLTLGGANPDDFVIAEESCLRRALNSDASCAVEIEFRPTDVGYRNALLVATARTGEYTTAFLGGYAGYEPTFGLQGFPAGVDVAIGFDDGSEPFASVTTSDTGAALALLQTPLRVRGGTHRLVASAGETAIATVEVTFNARTTRTTPGLPGYGLG
jgi:hypothetical protein